MPSSNPKLSLTAKVAPIEAKTITNLSDGTSSNLLKGDAIPSTSHSVYSVLNSNSTNRNNADEKADNKKNENAVEKRKKEEKLKLKAEKEARKVNTG